jgi:hypothetical protein
VRGLDRSRGVIRSPGGKASDDVVLVGRITAFAIRLARAGARMM